MVVTLSNGPLLKSPLSLRAERPAARLRTGQVDFALFVPASLFLFVLGFTFVTLVLLVLPLLSLLV